MNAEHAGASLPDAGQADTTVGLADGVRLIDLDSHVIEPWDLWTEGIRGPLRAAAPRKVADRWGGQRLMVESRLFPTPEGLGRAPRRMLSPEQQAKYQHNIAISQDPLARAEMMNCQGIDQAVLMPSQGLMIGAVRDAELAVEIARAYNDWLAQYCSHAPARLLGSVLVPLQSPREAVAEIRRAHDRLGLRSIVLKPNPVNGRNLNDPAYHPIYELCQDLDLPVFVHEGCGYAPGATLGIDRFENGLISHLLSHPFEQMAAMVALIIGGVLERFPRLRVGFLEAGCGWVPYWLERMDEHVEKLSWEAPWLSMSPRRYFARQCAVACEPDERIAKELLAHESCNIGFGTDFPHSDQLELDAPREARCFAGMSEAQGRRIARGTAQWLLGAAAHA